MRINAGDSAASPMIEEQFSTPQKSNKPFKPNVNKMR